MNAEQIQGLLDKQRAYFRSGATLPLSFRIEQLKGLRAAVRKYEGEIAQALREDLGKSAYEGFMCESGLALSEITYMLRHLRGFARERTVPTSLSQFPARSFTKSVPYGNVLVMSPWNYPFLLTIDPLADAIAAGNTVILKPSAYAPATGRVLERLVADCFPEEYVAVVTGGRAENQHLLDQKFDMIFFTGSQAVGREVLRRAAEHLTPVVLELGGKSPCIVDASADLPLAAKRIVFGKYLNCGQTCVAPDYVLCERSVKDALLAEIKGQIRLQYGERPLENEDYGRIVNEKHFHRLCGLIRADKLAFGGEIDAQGLRIAPTVLDTDEGDPAMEEEIFGPILPILTFDSFDDMLASLKTKAKPLALYIFSSDRAHIRRATDELSYGGGCINDVVIHLATSAMGFGGVGESGMGSYHGRSGFDAFSHRKSIVDKGTWLDLPMRYQPYGNRLYERLLHLFLK